MTAAPPRACGLCGCPERSSSTQALGVVAGRATACAICGCECHQAARATASLRTVQAEAARPEVLPEDAPMAAAWPRRCTCCEAPITEAEWLRLRKVGYCGAFRGAGTVWCLEMRDHDCGTTLAIEVEVAVLAGAR